MPDTALVCPFCNSKIEHVIDRTKPVCPRCDAPLPPSAVEQLSTPSEPGSRPIDLEPVTAPGKRTTLVAILGLMALMAMIAAGFTLSTRDFRRKNDFKKGFVVSEPASQTPEELATLGFLPARCNILAGVNLVDLRANPLARKTFFDPPTNSIAWLTETLRTTTGLSIDDIDQVAVGIEMTDSLPKIYVVAQTRADYDPQAILKPLAPTKILNLRNRPLVRFPLAQIGEGVVWCLDNRRIAFLFRVEPGTLEDLESIPVRPRMKLEGSSDFVKKLVDERVPKQSLAWVVGDLKSTSGLRDFLSVVGARTEPFRPLLDAQALAVSVRVDEDFVVLGQALAKSGDGKSTKELVEMIEATDWRGAKSMKIDQAPADAGEAPWVTIQWRYTPAAIRELASRGPQFRR